MDKNKQKAYKKISELQTILIYLLKQEAEIEKELTKAKEELKIINK